MNFDQTIIYSFMINKCLFFTPRKLNAVAFCQSVEY